MEKEIKKKRKPHIKRKGIDHIFQKYPFKTFKYKNGQLGARKGNYVKKKDRVEGHEFTTDYYLYKDIITTYFSFMANELMEGRAVYFPHRLGMLQLFKYQPMTKHIMPHKYQGKKYNNIHTGRFKPYVIWNRTTRCGGSKDTILRNWNFLPTASLWTKISKRLYEDPTYIHQLQQIGRSYD